MPDSAPQSEIDRLKAFELRMQTEGAAGFADGLEPWETWPEANSKGDNRVWESARRSEHEPPGKTQCEKLLSAVAMIAVATLAVGIGGIYLSTDTTKLMASNHVQPSPITAPALQEPGRSLTGSVIRRTPLPAVALPALEPVANPIIMLPPAAPSASIPSGAQPDDANVETAALEDVQDTTDTLPALAATGLVEATGVDEANDIDEAKDIPDTLPAPAAGTPARVALLTPPATVTASPPPTADATPPAPAGNGAWVVNISSYTYESMARKKLTEFKKKGVIAEVFPATVNNRPIYRIRATGYESYAEAKTWVSLLGDRLGVDSAWVSKR